MSNCVSEIAAFREVSGKTPVSPGGTITKTLGVSKPSPSCQLLLFLTSLASLVPMYWCNASPIPLNLHYETHRKSWQKNTRVLSWATGMLSKSSAYNEMAFVSVTLQQVHPSESSVFSNLFCKTQVPTENPIPVNSFQSLCNSLWTEVSRTKAIAMLNSLQGWLTESNFHWQWRVGILQVKLSWAIFISLNSQSVPTSVFDLTSSRYNVNPFGMYQENPSFCLPKGWGCHQIVSDISSRDFLGWL